MIFIFNSNSNECDLLEVTTENYKIKYDGFQYEECIVDIKNNFDVE